MSPWYPLRVVFWLSYEVDTRIAWAIDCHASPFCRMLVDQVGIGFERPYVIDEKAKKQINQWLIACQLAYSRTCLWISCEETLIFSNKLFRRNSNFNILPWIWGKFLSEKCCRNIRQRICYLSLYDIDLKRVLNLILKEIKSNWHSCEHLSLAAVKHGPMSISYRKTQIIVTVPTRLQVHSLLDELLRNSEAIKWIENNLSCPHKKGMAWAWVHAYLTHHLFPPSNHILLIHLLLLVTLPPPAVYGLGFGPTHASLLYTQPSWSAPPHSAHSPVKSLRQSSVWINRQFGESEKVRLLLYILSISNNFPRTERIGEWLSDLDKNGESEQT